MDNMAYLHQISHTGSAPNKQSSSKFDFGILKKIFTLRNGLIALAVVAVLVIVLVVTNSLNTVDNKERDLLIKSWYKASSLSETMDNYTSSLKSSDLRSMASSLRGVLNEITLNDANLLLNNYDIEVDDWEEDPIAVEELDANTQLANSLELGRLNGVLDRTFTREIILQIAYLISYQSECAARSEDQNVITATTKAESNLQNLYDRFVSYQDLSN